MLQPNHSLIQLKSVKVLGNLDPGHHGKRGDEVNAAKIAVSHLHTRRILMNRGWTGSVVLHTDARPCPTAVQVLSVLSHQATRLRASCPGGCGRTLTRRQAGDVYELGASKSW